MKQVVIVGAGVIGLTLAKELALNGIEVTVFDSKRKVSDNTAKASGIFSKEGMERIGFSREGSMVTTLNGATIHAGGENLKVFADSTIAYVLDRGLFAEACAREAESAGAKLVLNKRLTKEDILSIKNQKDTILVGADGAVSNVASAVGFPKIREYILTYKAEYTGVEVKDEHKVELFFSNKIAKRFFGWTVPYRNGVLEVGIGISSLSKRNSTSAFNEFVNTAYMKEMLKGTVKRAGYASMIPLESRKKTVIDNVLLVGDAAGQVKATTGGGIIFGASCAKVAAKVITEHATKGRPLESYESAWRKDYEMDLKLHKAIHGYYSILGERTFAMAIKAAKLMGFEGFLSKYGDMDRPSLMVKRFFLRSMAK